MAADPARRAPGPGPLVAGSTVRRARSAGIRPAASALARARARTAPRASAAARGGVAQPASHAQAMSRRALRCTPSITCARRLRPAFSASIAQVRRTADPRGERQPQAEPHAALPVGAIENLDTTRLRQRIFARDREAQARTLDLAVDAAPCPDRMNRTRARARRAQCPDRDRTHRIPRTRRLRPAPAR